ncbi:hypothetical protein PYCC9005_001451 [Savitreella phatthalungensis]
MTRVWVLPLRYGPERLREVEEVLAQSRDVEQVVDVAHADLVVTSLTQRVRLERELRMAGAAGVTVIRTADFLDMCRGGTFELARARAWLQFAGTRVARTPAVPHEPSEDLTAAPRNAKYACERETPLVAANEKLCGLIERLRLARTLQGDFVGERAYSSTLASLRAYPDVIQSANEVLALQGCGRKVVNLTKEFLATGDISEVREIWSTEEMQTLEMFWNCHGVGAVMARTWYFERGYRHINDAVRDWDTLPRAVQVGVKHYDDFCRKIPRADVEEIAEMVRIAAQELASPDPVDLTICGGYRRGKIDSGDVDVVLTSTNRFGLDTMLDPLLQRLEDTGLVDTVIRSAHERDGSKIQDAGGGMSVALTVILFKGVRRRLDIIVCPPATYAICVLGWSGATTFERDLRRFVSVKKSWQFDSTGIVHQTDKRRVVLDDLLWRPGVSIVELEKSLFGKLGLEYIPPELRNTG